MDVAGVARSACGSMEEMNQPADLITGATLLLCGCAAAVATMRKFTAYNSARPYLSRAPRPASAIACSRDHRGHRTQARERGQSRNPDTRPQSLQSQGKGYRAETPAEQL